MKEEGVERECDKDSVCPSDAGKHYRTDSFSDFFKKKESTGEHELELSFLVPFLNPL